MKIENLKEVVESREVKEYEYKEYFFKINRQNNDINGNPLYRIELKNNDYDNITFKLKGQVYRCYSNKGYALIQSYNILTDLQSIFNNI